MLSLEFDPKLDSLKPVVCDMNIWGREKQLT